MSKPPEPPDTSNLRPCQRQAIRQAHFELAKIQEGCATKGGFHSIARIMEDLEADFPFLTED